MRGQDPSRRRTEQALLTEECGFSGAFLAVQYLRQRIDSSPKTVSAATIEALLFQIRSPRFDRKKQLFFLLGEAADALISLALTCDTPTCQGIIAALQEIIAGATGARVRAVGNAMGKLPVTLPSADIHLPDEPAPLKISLNDLTCAFGAPSAGPPEWQGRSLTIPLAGNLIGVIKFASSEDNIRELARESFWQGQMEQVQEVDPETWQIPCPVLIGTSNLFRVSDLSSADPPAKVFNGVCIAYTATPGYFDYPNDAACPVPWEKISGVFFTTARTLGKLTAAGLFHTALIPLFHNRVQQDRRSDNGRYLWEHGGRLDQWLDSCRFPNFSASGLRDFEHLEPAASSNQLRHTIGEHLLSFILVMGSCFRSQSPERRGKDNLGRPVDTRDLFDEDRFCRLLEGVCRRYFAAFTPTPLPRAFLERIPALVDDLIETMGIDKDMAETLRVQDQNNMDEAAYHRFLEERGLHPAPLRGRADIVLETGPHLGGFNQPISVPGLVDFLYNFSSLCVSYCFEKENRLKA